MPPIVAVVGYSNSGKTRVAVSLVQFLAGRGHRVAAVKHCHLGHQMDRLDSDTDRLYRAGAVVVIASSPDQTTRMEQVIGDTSLDALTSSLRDNVDIVIAEGFKGSCAPKVLVVGESGPPASVENLIAVVGDAPSTHAVPQYCFGELDGLAEQIQTEFLGVPVTDVSVSLMVDGIEVPLKRYPSQVLQGIVNGFVSSLNGVPTDPVEIKITVKTASTQRISSDQ